MFVMSYCRLEEKWSAVKVPLNVPSFDELVSFNCYPASGVAVRPPLVTLSYNATSDDRYVYISTVFVRQFGRQSLQ